MRRIATFCIVLVTALCFTPTAIAGKFADYYNKGIDEYGNKNYIKAIEWFKKASKIDKKDPEPHANIGLCRHYLKEYRAAIVAFRKAIELDRTRAEYHSRLGNSYAELKEFDKAVAAYQETLKLNPNNFRTRFNLALVLDNAKDTTRAEAEYKNILSRIGSAISSAKAKNDGNRLKNLRETAFKTKKALAVLYFNGRRFSEAIELLEKATAERPQNADVHFLVGVVLASQGKLKDAILNLQKAVKLNHPNPSEVYKHIGNTYFSMKKYDEAIKAYKKAIFESPSSGSAYHNLGELYRFRNELKKAIEMYEMAAARRKNDPAPWRGIGEVRSEQDRLLEAEEAYRKAASLEPGDKETLIDLANILSDLGNFSGALSELKFVKALGGSPELEALVAVTEKRLARRKAGPVKDKELEEGRLWSKAWVSSGKRFKVRSNTAPEFCEEFLEDLEKIVRYYVKEFDIRADMDKGTTKVYVFNRRDEYREFCRETAPKLAEAAGFFDPKRRLIATYRRKGILNRENTQVLQHEALHLATYLAFHRNLPGWLAEGLAEYYELAVVGKGGKVTPSGIRVTHVDTILKHLAKDKALSARAILSSKQERYFDSRDSIYYAQAWTLVHLFKTKHSSEFDKMLLNIRRGQEPDKAANRMIKDIFGSDAALENAWKLHFKSIAEKAKKKK